MKHVTTKHYIISNEHVYTNFEAAKMAEINLAEDNLSEFIEQARAHHAETTATIYIQELMIANARSFSKLLHALMMAQEIQEQNVLE